MRFIDEARVHVQSGRGGDGCASFRREKFVPLGGPDGGDGGRGGDVVVLATTRRNTLLELRGKAHWHARKGQPGSSRQKTGRGGEDVIIEVPVGTRIFDDESGELLHDLVEDGQRVIVARGGRGGQGNASFKSATNRAPTEFTPGEEAEERWLRLELMLMADVGLVGFPNAGKSTLISRISAARPRVADYPFTTLVPNLGVVDLGLDGSFVVADVPGLIEGAAAGAGLGHRFLKHIQRTRLILHLVSLGPHEHELAQVEGQHELDLPEVSRRVLARYEAIRRELQAYDAELAHRPELVVLTKADLVAEDELAQARATLAERVGADRLLAVSAVAGRGLPELIRRVQRALAAPAIDEDGRAPG